MEQAEQTDRSETNDGRQLPEELSRREALKAKLEAARSRIEACARKKTQAEQNEYEQKVREREKREGSKKGPHIQPLDPTPQPEEQENLNDPDSRLMRHNKRRSYEQAYNTQATVDADGSQLVLSAPTSQCSSDRNELVKGVRSIPRILGQPHTAMTDNGYLNEKEVRTLEGKGETPEMNVQVSVHTEAKQLHRKHDFRPQPIQEKEPPVIRSEFVLEMKEKMAREENQNAYLLRKQTV